MSKGIPRNGRRDAYKRWELKTLWPLHQRWLGGETLDDVAKSVGTTRGRLRGAFDYYGLLMRPNKGQSKFRKASDYDSNHVVTESWKRSRNFDASLHRAARHYKGNFDL